MYVKNILMWKTIKGRYFCGNGSININWSVCIYYKRCMCTWLRNIPSCRTVLLRSHIPTFQVGRPSVLQLKHTHIFTSTPWIFTLHTRSATKLSFHRPLVCWFCKDVWLKIVLVLEEETKVIYSIIIKHWCMLNCI